MATLILGLCALAIIAAIVLPRRIKVAMPMADREWQFNDNNEEEVVIPMGRMGRKRRVPYARRSSISKLGNLRLIDQNDPYSGHLVDEPMYLLVVVKNDRKVPGNRQRNAKARAKARRDGRKIKYSQE